MNKLIVRQFDELQDYQAIWQSMQVFTANREKNTPDELWLLEHEPVYTQGQAGKFEHLLNPGNIPVVQTDRGGQITWHGPGQLMVYALLDTHRLNLGARVLINHLEKILIVVLDSFGISAYAKSDAPGVYVLHQGTEAKIAALGLRVKKNGCYHGAALNIDCDLSPFSGINPCGYAGQIVTRLIDVLPQLPSRSDIEKCVIEEFSKIFSYD
ncbi:MAG TPA: lipoyl(octanoyl) transferase LipB [Pseudomonadales bacterium]|nr:lipoyl(octanoyl) transferase LipB [Pseudomonadales bacterium]